MSKNLGMVDQIVRKALEAAGEPNRPYRLKKKNGQCFILLPDLYDPKGRPRGPVGNDWAGALMNLTRLLNQEMQAKALSLKVKEEAPPPPILKQKKLTRPTFTPKE